MRIYVSYVFGEDATELQVKYILEICKKGLRHKDT